MMAAQRLSGRRLSELLRGFGDVRPDQDREVNGLSLDSRALTAGGLFLACAGTRDHGAQFIGEAVRAGAVAVALETRSPEDLPARVGVPVIPVPGLSGLVGEVAARFYGYPSRRLNVVGVTGTNGKTSVSHFIAQALADDSRLGPCGLVGTVGYGEPGALQAASTTTPDPVQLQRLLAEMCARRSRSAVLEVSSHGLQQNRDAGTRFNAAVFTNLSRDHLDYHGDMASYGRAKRLLFERPGLRHAAVNFGDPFGRQLVEGLPAELEIVGFALDEPLASALAHSYPCVLGALQLRGQEGITVLIDSPWGKGSLRSPLPGRFNAVNLVAALTCLLQLGVDFPEALHRLERVKGAPGRLECLGGGERPLVVIDYAHTPDALEHVLLALRPLCRGDLWCVFGCGGERDPGKRPLMGAVAAKYADHVIVTNDNPRGEDPAAIIKDILGGMHGAAGVEVEYDRAKAIASAVRDAKAGNVVLVAGKGHETHQEIAGQRLPFSDRAVVQRLFGEPAR